MSVFSLPLPEEVMLAVTFVRVPTHFVVVKIKKNATETKFKVRCSKVGAS